MIQRNPAQAYRQTSIETMSPGQITLMLFEGALRFVDKADQGFLETDFIRGNETVNNNIVRAQSIVVELKASLNFKADEAFCQNISALYTYIYECLNEANLKKKREPLSEARRHLKELRSAWYDMLENIKKTQSPMRSLCANA